MRPKHLFLALVAMPFLAVPAQAGDQTPFPLDDFLTEPVRQAFAQAARKPTLWSAAQRDPLRYFASVGVAVPENLGVAFLDQLRGGDWIGFERPGEALYMYCPTERVWWQECRKVIRVCESEEQCIPDGAGSCRLVKIEKNCAFVCEESIWDPVFTLWNRPPFPPRP